MKEQHPFQLIIMVVFAVAALAGLLLFANFSGSSGNSTKAGEVLIWGTFPKEAVEAGIQELTASSEDYGDVVYEEKEESSWKGELANALASGKGPDLIILSQEELLTDREKLMPIPFSTLPERTFVDSYVPIFDLFLGEEGTYGIPLVVDPLVLYYNRSILASAGAATTPRTWEAVSGLASVISQRDDGSAIVRSTIAFGEYGNVQNARAILSLLLLQAGTPITMSTKGVVESVLGRNAVDSPFGTTPAESAVGYFSQFGDPAKTVYSWNRALPNSRQAFLSSDVALYPGFASEFTFISEANPNLNVDMTMVPQPGTATDHITYAKAYVLAVTKASDNQTGALQTAFALSQTMPAKAIAESLSIAPALRVLLTSKPTDRYAAVYYPEALVAKGWLSPAPSEVDAIFGAMIGNISSGRSEVPAALQTASKAIDAAVNR